MTVFRISGTTLARGTVSENKQHNLIVENGDAGEGCGHPYLQRDGEHCNIHLGQDM